MHIKVLFLTLIIATLNANEQLTRFMKERFNCGITKEEIETARTPEGLNVAQILRQEVRKASDRKTLLVLVEIYQSIPQESLNLLTANIPKKQTFAPATRLYCKKPASKPDETFKRYTDIGIVCVTAVVFTYLFTYSFQQSKARKSL